MHIAYTIPNFTRANPLCIFRGLMCSEIRKRRATLSRGVPLMSEVRSVVCSGWHNTATICKGARLNRCVIARRSTYPHGPAEAVCMGRINIAAARIFRLSTLIGAFESNQRFGALNWDLRNSLSLPAAGRVSNHEAGPPSVPCSRR
ncbi:hypothetical protein EVAR_36017_1 [Eumeta japonica]|uniref:Uncharacterized protein n=1 Tax=Eumeta variegata TaxID=151549 RepID=A0A4C1WWA4_EUMVA|nr:hypothetical protein EVAR_36017_1 [Eumeta japonica]